MTEPSQPPIGTDPITAILLAVTRIEGNLSGALDTLKRHDVDLANIKTTQAAHGNRLTILETKGLADEGHTARRVSDRVVFWSMVSALAIIAGLVVTILVAGNGG